MGPVNNDPMLERVDAAAASVTYALLVLRQAQEGVKDADLYGCSMSEAEQALTRAQTDLRAAGSLF